MKFDPKIIGLAIIGASSWTVTPNIAAAQTALTPAYCQPLTEQNLAACCAASNWRDLILTDDVAFCPPLNEDDDESGRLGQALGTSAAAGPAGEAPTNISEEPTDAKSRRMAKRLRMAKSLRTPRGPMLAPEILVKPVQESRWIQTTTPGLLTT